MAINILHVRHQGEPRWGVLAADGLRLLDLRCATTGEFLAWANVERLSAKGGAALPLASLELLSPVTRNQQFICQGANYRQHMIESGIDPDAKSYNMIFTKAPGCIVPADNEVVIPRGVRLLDYEIELGLVLRRNITAPVTVSDATLHEFVAALVIVNDYSARDIQIPQLQFYKGKSFRTFGPVGPHLCWLEAQDYSLLRALDLRLTVNGDVRQQDSSANLVHGPATTISELSRVHDLAAGTPAGCALAVPSPRQQRLAALLPERLKWQAFLRVQARRSQYLKPGDVVEARIASRDGRIDLGTQRNRIVAEG